MSYLSKSYTILSKVIREDAYANIAINDIKDDDKDKALITKIVYGTLEKYFELSYIISGLSNKAPQQAIKIILMQAIYCLRYLSIPPYAVVNESVNLTAEIGKKEVKGFVNAVLNKVAKKQYSLPIKGDKEYEEVFYNLPQWLIAAIKKEYPIDYQAILSATGSELEHIRLSNKMDSKTFATNCTDCTATLTGFFARNSDYIKDLYNKGMLTYQSYTSTLVVKALGDIKDKTFLDICSAPGGKSVFASELGARVTACDFYPHRVELIKKYADRMGGKLNIVMADGTKHNKEWKQKFDIVLTDVPCSGLGVISKRQDIIFKRSLSDITRLSQLQLKILKNASNYVKSGGVLVYSTCTILRAENQDVVNSFLKSNKNFALTTLKLPYENKGELQFLPNNDGYDGFYIAMLKRIS